MPAGIKIDKLIAQQVMRKSKPLKYSTDIAAAWEVLEQVYDAYGHFKIRLMKYHLHQGIGWAQPYGCQIGEGVKFVCADTPALAICRAALTHIKNRKGKADG